MWEKAGLERLIEEQRARYAEMAVGDAYKLLFQGVRGPEHLIASAEDFAARLRAEYAALPAAEDAPLWEAVRPDGALGRLNLRPFKARGGTLEWLIAAVLRTAARRWGTLAELQAAWATFLALCREGRWRQFPPDEVRGFSAWLEAQGWPAVHHSAAYRQAHRPAYRLIAQSELCEGF